MIDTILRSIFTSQWLVFLVVTALLLGLAEVGFRTGLRLHRASDEARKSQIGSTMGAVLGLLGLLLGFTFALAAARYEGRRELVLKEANAVGTTFLRASFLPDAHRIAVEGLLRRYTEVRMDFYAAGEDETKIAAAERAAAQLQSELWAHTVAAGREAPTPLVPTFINALNETIDLDATRMNALRNHVPGAVWLLVLAVAGCGCGLSGCAAGATGVRSTFSVAVLPLLTAVVITLIADLDRPRGGLIGISQQPLIDLQQTLTPNQP